MRYERENEKRKKKKDRKQVGKKGRK